MKKRSVKIAGHATSVSLEDEFWAVLQDMATAQDVSVNTLIGRIDAARQPEENLSSALRVYVLRGVMARGRE